jgi:hypothetical protein
MRIVACMSLGILLVAGVDSGANAQGFTVARIKNVDYLWGGPYLSMKGEAQGGEVEGFAAASIAFRDSFTNQRIVVDTPRGEIRTIYPGGIQQFDFYFGNLSAAPPFDFVVSLWNRLVDISECQRGPGGGPCEDCQKNGFHMEGRLHSTGWIPVRPGLNTPNVWYHREY